MSIVTMTLASPTIGIAGPATTTTVYILTTIIGLPGQTLTILPQTSLTSTTPSMTQYTTIPTNLPPVEIYTANEWTIVFQALDSRPWTTVTYVEEVVAPAPTGEPYVPGQYAIVVPNVDSGWDTWTHAQKGGLIAGLVLFVLLMVGLLYCTQQKRQDWVVDQGPPQVNARMVERGYRPDYQAGGYGHGRWGYYSRQN